MKIHDLHNHTIFSYDGKNRPEEIVKNALANGIDVVGISDHQFTIGASFMAYADAVAELKEKYSDKIEVLLGLEIGTRPAPNDFLMSHSHLLDYCLFESLDSPVAMDFFEFLEWTRLFNCPVGLAHTDIFALGKRYGVDILKTLSEHNIFWEINTSGNYDYYYDFLTNREKQRMVSESNIILSVGSDTHWIGDYNAEKVVSANKLVAELGNPTVFKLYSSKYYCVD